MNRAAFKISFWYFLIGLSWVVISDFVLNLLSNFKSSLILGEIIKGSSFILATAILLYLLITKYNAKILENKKQHERLFEDNPHPMWVYELKDFRILAVNHAALLNYGYSRSEFMQLDLAKLRPEEEVPKLMENLKLKEKIYSNSGTWLHKKKNGEIFYVNIQSHFTKFRNKEARLVLALDVNEKYRAEQQIRWQNIKLKEIAHIQSHRIRRPVASILGLVNLFDQNNIDHNLNSVIIEKMGIVCGDLDKIIHTIVDKTHALEIEDAKRDP